jgi:hypothetical protein
VTQSATTCVLIGEEPKGINVRMNKFERNRKKMFRKVNIGTTIELYIHRTERIQI